MTFTPILAFSFVALTFALGDYIALRTKGVISTFITAIIVFIIFGGVMKFLPPNLMELSGLTSLIPTFGMVLILTNLGSTLDLNELKKEWKTILVSLAGVIGIVGICFTLGQIIFGREYALSAIAPISGGIVATMISNDTAIAAGRPDIASYVSSVTALQILIGLPISSFCLRKAAAKFINSGNLQKDSSVSDRKKINIHFLPSLPKTMDVPTTHFARLALVGAFAQAFAGFTGINATISYLVFGALGAAIGVIDRNCLKKAGGDGVMLLATYAYVTGSFVTMTFSEFASILLPVFGMLVIGAVGVSAFASVMGLIFHWDLNLSIATGLSCMFGYPVTYAVAMEVVNGATIDKEFTEQEVKTLTDYLLPKMLIAGVTSVSVASVVIASIVAPMIFI